MRLYGNNGFYISNVTANSAGIWSYTPSLSSSYRQFPDGTYNITATATDQAGNISSISSAITLSVDTTPPVAPTFTSATLSGTLSANISIASEVGSSIILTEVGGNTKGSGSTPQGTITFTATWYQASWTMQLYMIATDAAGNSTNSDNNLNVKINSIDASLIQNSMNLTGSANADTIAGSKSNDTIVGGGGSDTLTGNAGSDTFVYINQSDSNVGSFDVITDFNSVDLLKIGHLVSPSSFNNQGAVVSTGNLQNDLTAALSASTQNFIQSSAALVSITGSASDVGTYVVIANHTNATPGFVAATDTVIKLQNYSGGLSSSNFVA